MSRKLRRTVHEPAATGQTRMACLEGRWQITATARLNGDVGHSAPRGWPVVPRILGEGGKTLFGTNYPNFRSGMPDARRPTALKRRLITLSLNTCIVSGNREVPSWEFRHLSRNALEHSELDAGPGRRSERLFTYT